MQSEQELLERRLRVRLQNLSSGALAGRVHPFVTISRQAGAGGHTLAHRLIEVFENQSDADLFGGWQVFDRALCELAVQDTAIAHTLDTLVSEEYRSKADELVRQFLRPSVDQDFVMGRVFQVVRAVASAGKAVIVGRAAAQATAGMRPAVRLRVVAPDEPRIERLMELEHVDHRLARDHMRRLDTNRARLLSTHFGVDIDDPTAYDAVVNTASITTDEIADLVTVLLRRRAIETETDPGGQPATT